MSEGHAYNDRPAHEYQVGIGVGDGGKILAVRGPRRCQRLATRGLTFTSLGPADKVALSYKNAFGGRDKAAESKYWTHLDERLIAGSPERWAAMPLPWSTGWMDIAAFPRAAYAGATPQVDPATLPLAEIKRGFASKLPKPGGPFDQLDFRLKNGGALGLQFPYLLPGAAMFLGGLHRSVPRLRFGLPAEQPTFWSDGRNGKLVKTKPVIHTIRIAPDDHVVAITWRGAAPALRPYGDDELTRMPFKVQW